MTKDFPSRRDTAARRARHWPRRDPSCVRLRRPAHEFNSEVFHCRADELRIAVPRNHRRDGQSGRCIDAIMNWPCHSPTMQDDHGAAVDNAFRFGDDVGGCDGRIARGWPIAGRPNVQRSPCRATYVPSIYEPRPADGKCWSQLAKVCRLANPCGRAMESSCLRLRSEYQQNHARFGSIIDRRGRTRGVQVLDPDRAVAELEAFPPAPFSQHYGNPSEIMPLRGSNG